MNSLIGALPLLIVMAALIFLSAFFSASEAALFSLRSAERNDMKNGSLGERTALRLLLDPDRLLSAVLFWNLIINLVYFVLGSIVSLRIERDPESNRFVPIVFAIGSLLVLIFCCEMLPKTIGVLLARRLSSMVSIPIRLAVRVVDPCMPILMAVNRISARVLWPSLKSETVLAVSDLERAIQLSVTDAKLLDQEQAVLRNMVQLSEIRVDEWMRPRSQYRSFRPPVSLAALRGEIPPSGYLLITEPDSDELEFAISLLEAFDLPDSRLEQRAERVMYAPWCATMAEVLEKMRSRGRQVTAVTNEYGETIGVLTLDDIMEAIFTYEPSRSKTLLDQKPIHFISENKWLVSGMTNLRRLVDLVSEDLPPTKNVTVSGVIQESLQRIAQVGDECDWGPFFFRVLEMPQRGHMLIEMIVKPTNERETS
jgi:CBS domain containing-hemolysin-like protein